MTTYHIIRKFQICPIWCQSDPRYAICHPCLILRLELHVCDNLKTTVKWNVLLLPSRLDSCLVSRACSVVIFSCGDRISVFILLSTWNFVIYFVSFYLVWNFVICLVRFYLVLGLSPKSRSCLITGTCLCINV